ncbi:serine protease [Actinoplanes ianthinogenes]|uniref:Serine protease n=1 Tax=Actinoplanes ianthinogenes TaxID=122358 RepID=A0ABM7M3V9_9ACTN|nr:S8 family serine peptidase [Actinoplanes ianthinogenes]BCJ46352.1 serine protease [Actinoplanes ianthinogenes]GGR33699.1 serine protease [Actinoplanes ianthinogenes]
MRQPSRWGRRTFTSVLAIGLAAGVTTVSGSLPATAAPAPVSEDNAPATEDVTPKDSPADTLGSHDAGLLAEAQAEHRPSVTVIIATDQGRTADVATRVKGLGGTIARQFDQVGYVLATVPTGKVLNTAKLPGVAGVDLDETVQVPKPDLTGDASAAKQGSPPSGPGASTPADNPYLPVGETGSVDFKRKHPSYDGRGVTIGIMDSGVDLAHPALQTTTTGERKIVDWVTATDPLVENDLTWRAMRTAVTGPTFTYQGATWTAPAGNWLINRFSESITAASEPAGDVNRDGDTTDVWGILYDPVSHDIRVDTNQNFDFTDDAVMRPYKEKFDIGWFGTDNPATPVAERMPFVVEYREDVDLTPAGLPGQVADFVNIGIPEGLHASHVAGIAAGNDLFGNRNFDGQAPGAKIVSARACSWGGGCTAAALTTGMVDLVVNRHVDVVNLSIGGLPALNDGSSAQSQLYQQLITKYGVQLFISAGNSGSGVNTVGDPSVSTDAVSVAASVSKETWLANYGSVTRKPLQLFPFSSRGPREDGGFKPNLSAPGSAISAVPTWEPVAGLDTVGYTLPNGYAMENGTSMAAPQATGGAALLLSAAKQNKLTVSPAQLRRAIYSTADTIPGEQAYEQGYGQLDVPASWKLLTKISDVRSYTASAPVCTPLAPYLSTPGVGTGIYNRCAASEGGFTAGQSRWVSLSLTRTSGPNRLVLHRLRWEGDDKAFLSTPVVALPLNKTVTIPVRVTAGRGVTSALLTVDDPATPAVDFEVLNTVVTGTEAKAPSYANTFSGAVDRNSTTSFFVTVPAGATSLQVDLGGIAAGSQTRWIAINPYGVPVEPTSSPYCYTNYSDPATCKPEERSYDNPLPGVWELEVESRRTSPLLSNPFALTAKVQGVTVEPATVTLPSVQVGAATPASWTVTNRFGPISIIPKGGPLGSSLTQRPSIAQGGVQDYTVVVPAGATRLTVAIGNAADPAADLDLYLYDANHVEKGRSADGDSEEAVTLNAPAPGTYTVEIQGYSVPAGTTEYDYQDTYYSPALGELSAPSTPVALGAGASATITGTVTVAAVPPAGRHLSGQVTFETDEGAVVGRGTVTIESVTG